MNPDDVGAFVLMVGGMGFVFGDWMRQTLLSRRTPSKGGIVPGTQEVWLEPGETVVPLAHIVWIDGQPWVRWDQ